MRGQERGGWNNLKGGAMTPPVKYGMVGGGRNAFIGAVHRMAAALDQQTVLAAGALSVDPEEAKLSGRDLNLPEARNYTSWQAMVEGEAKLPREQRVDFVSVVTPNFTHFDIAKAFIEIGVNVVCEKPMVTSSEQARDLTRLVDEKKVVFGVTYNYSGYPLVKHARHLVKSGKLGQIRKVIVEYNQGWLATALEQTGQPQASWRTDPKRAGLGGAIGDIGSHAEQLTSYITGLELDAVCADLTAFVSGRKLDDDANVLMRFVGGAKGILTASQIEIGHENDLRIRVYGTEASLEWHQEEPNRLVFTPLGAPEQVLRRGNAYLSDEAKANTRIPPGHPEAFVEAFANVYRGVITAVRAGKGGSRYGGEGGMEFPTVRDGARGVHFIEKVVESAQSEKKWTPARFE